MYIYIYGEYDDYQWDCMGKIRINGIGGFQSHGGTPSYHPFLIDGIFHEINQPFWDTSIYGNPHIQNVKNSCKSHRFSSEPSNCEGQWF